MEVKNLINDLNLYYLNNLKKTCLENNLNLHLINEKINEIDKNNIDSVTITESENSFNNIDSYVYKKDWNKLHLTHKKIKIKQFVEKLNIKDNNDKKELIKRLIDLIVNKKLTKKNSVNYNSEEGFITSIPNLEFNENKYEINI